MQASPNGQQSIDESLEGSAKPDLSNQQHKRPQQQQGTGGQGNDNGHDLFSGYAGVWTFETKKPRCARTARTAVIHNSLLSYNSYTSSLRLICRVFDVFLAIRALCGRRELGEIDRGEGAVEPRIARPVVCISAPGNHGGFQVNRDRLFGKGGVRLSGHEDPLQSTASRTHGDRLGFERRGIASSDEWLGT
jgi:hypothetical protein